MNFKIHSIQRSLASRGLEERGAAQRFLDSEVLRTTDPYVPLDTGKLKQAGILGTTIGSGEIVYNSPYARYQYYGKLMVGKAPKTLTGIDLKYHSGDSKRGAMWFERSKADNLNAWLKGVADVIGGRT